MSALTAPRPAHQKILSLWLSFLVMVAVVAGVPMITAPAEAALTEMCYVFADGGNTLGLINRVTGVEVAAPNAAGVSNIEAIALHPTSGVLYGADAYRLGTINTMTGVYSNIASFGTADDGAGTTITIADVDGLAFTPGGVLWGVDARSGDDALVQIDPNTGLVVEDAFPGGRDFVYITGGFQQIDDIGIDPTTGTMYGIDTNLSNDQVVSISAATGVATALPNLAGVADLEGMSFDTSGQMIATTGSQGSTPNRLFRVNKATGVATQEWLLGVAGSDYEAVECFVGGTAEADLELTKTVIGTAPTNVGDSVTFEISVTNLGPDDASGVVVADQLPAGISYGSHSGDGSYASGSGLWSVGALGVGATATLQITAVVTESGAITNVAEVSASDTADPDSTPDNDDGDQSEDDEDAASISTPPAADLRLVKAASNPTPQVGAVVTYTITLSNDGPDDATGVTVADAVPAGLSGVTNISGGGSLAGSTITWAGLSIADGGSLDLTFDATVDAPTGALNEYLNVTEVTNADQYDPDSTPDNDDGDHTEDDEANVAIDPQVADLELAKAVSSGTPAVGATVTFTLTLDNVGPDGATGVSVADVVPAGFSAVTNISGGGTMAGSTITWNGLSVAAGASIQLTFDAVVDPPTYAAGEYRNVTQVTASDQYDPDSTPNNDDGDQSEDEEANVEVSTPLVADLEVAKSVDQATPNVGDVVTFTVVVSNTGPDAASSVAITDTVPAAYGSITNISAGGSLAGNIITWAGLSIPVAGSVTLTFDATVLAPTGTADEYLNTVQVTAGDQYDPDSVPDNDDGDQSEDDEDNAATTPQVIDLMLDKTVSPQNANVGDTVTFTVTVINDGPDLATAVDVSDVLPDGYTYNAGSIAGGDSRSDAGAPTLAWTIDSLGVGFPNRAVLSFAATVVAPPATYVNVAQVMDADQYDADSTANNDDGDQSEDDEDNAAVTLQSADLELVKDVSDATPNVGDVVTFSIDVSNLGRDDATGVAVEDAVPAGFSNISNISNGGTLSGSTIGWTGLAVTTTTPVTLTFQATVEVPTGASNEYLNVAEVTASDQLDSDSTPNNDDGDQSEDDEDNAPVTPQQADLSLTKSVSDPTPGVGQSVTFSLTVDNDGPAAATNIDVTDFLPSGYSYVANSIAGGDSRSDAAVPTLTWTINTLADNASTVLTFDAIVQAPTAVPVDFATDLYQLEFYFNGATFANTVIPLTGTLAMGATHVVADIDAVLGMTPDQTDISNFFNGDDAVVLTHDGSYVDVFGQVGFDPGSQWSGGGVGTQNQTLRRVPNVCAGDPIGNDAFNPSLEWIEFPQNTFGGLDSHTVTCGPGAELFISEYVEGSSNNKAIEIFNPMATGEYLNVAEITDVDQYDPDSTPDNDDGDQSEDDEDNATVNPHYADLSLVKTVSDPAANVGDVVTFSVTVSNAGTSDATGVAVADVVPVGFGAITNISGGGTLAGSTITWSGMTVAVGSPITLTFDATVDAPTGAGSEYVNVAQITASSEPDLDSTPNNDDGDQSEDDEDNAVVTPPLIDLSVDKTVSDPTPNVGQTVSFSIRIENAGPDTATNVSVEDVVPDGYSSITSISNGGTLAGSTITWSGLTVATAAPLVVTFDATVEEPPLDYRNVAQVTAADQYDTDSTPNNDDGDQSEDDESAVSILPERADLSLDKTVSNATPNVGDVITYTMTVTNDGPDDVTGVGVVDTTLSGVSNIINVSNGGTATGATVTWSGLTVTVATPLVLTFQATVDAPTGTPNEYLNVAEVTASDRYDPDSTPDNDDGDQSEDDEDNAVFVPQVADLELTKTVSESAPQVGDTVTFTVLVSNVGPDAATNVSVEDAVPSGYSSISSISNGGTLSGTTITWSSLTIPASGSITLTFGARVDGPTGAAAEYVNVAEVTAGDQFDPDSTPGNDNGDQSEDDEDNASVSPVVIDLELAKTVSNSTPNVGEVVTFSIEVANLGPDDATGVAVRDVVPGGYSNIINISNGGTLIGSTITWTGLAVATTAPVTLTFQATVNAPPRTYANVAQVTAADQYDVDSTPNNDDGDQSEDDEDNVTVTPQRVDLELAKTVSNPTPNVGDVVTFTIQVTNAGPDDATGVAVQDVVPGGFSNIINISNGGILAGSTITWTGLAVPVGSPLTLTFQATVNAPPRTYVNVAQVTAADQYDTDSTPNNDDGDQSEDDEDNAPLVPQVADLSLVKAVSDTAPLIGQVVTFTVTVNNAGPSGATGVAVEDVVPDGYSNIINISNGGTLAGSTVTWTGQAVPASGQIGLTFQATVAAPPASYRNIAEVTASDQYDPDSTPDNDDGDQSEDDEDSVDLSPQEADLELAKSVSDATPNVGDAVTFSITVTNDGPDDATGVAVQDVVPAGYSTITTISNGGTLAGSTITWSGLAVAVGSPVTLTFLATVEAPSGDYANVAEVTASDQLDPDSTPGNDDGDQSEDDEDSAAVAPQQVDLELAKTVSDTAPNVGDVVTFSVTVTNDGPDDATGVAVQDVVPGGYSNIATISNGGTLAGSTITWTGLAVPVGSPVTLTFQAEVGAPAADYLNIAQVTASDQFDVDSTPGNDDGDQSEDDEDNAAVTPQEADLELAKTVSDTAPNIGDVVTFTLTVTNLGPDDATGVAVEDTVPNGFSTITSISNGGILAGPTITWSGLAVPVGPPVTLTFQATVAAPPADYENVAEVTASDQFDVDSTPGNDDGDQSEDDEDGASLVPQEADLELAKTVSNATPNVGDMVTFTVTVTNDGPDDATGVAVEDMVPAGYSSIASISNGGTLAGSTITWTVLAVPAGGSIALTFEATVEAPTGAAGEYENVAEVTASDQYDPDSTPDNDDGDQSEDDEDSAATTPQQADLELVKAVSDATPAVGDVVTFTLTVTDVGPDDATGVAVEDTVPAGYSNITTISNGGTLAGSTIVWTGLAVPTGGSLALTFEATVEAPPADYLNIAEVTASEQFDVDSTPGNDDGDQSEDDESNALVAPAVIGLAKAVSNVSNNGDGTYAVAYLLTVENLAGVTVSDLIISDDVVSQFAAISPVGFAAQDGTLAANPGWDGTAGSNVLATGQSLAAGESGTVQISFTVTPGTDTGPHLNTATVIGSTPSGGTVTDDSTDGMDPDPNGDEVPSEDTPTPVSFDEAPSIGVAKDVTAGPTSNGDGSFDVTYTIVVENTGDVVLSDVQASDDLAATYAAAVSWNLVSVSSPTLTVSPSFDGAGDVDLLTGTDTLNVGASGTIEITVTVVPGDELGPYWNTATATGSSPGGTTVTDVSQDGPDVDPDDNGNPADNNDPTPVVFDELGNVTGVVWIDEDADGVIDPTELGIGGVTVELVDAGPDGIVGTGDDVVIGTTVTAPDGSYDFVDVPAGDYVIVIDPATLPVGLQPTFDPDGILDDMTPVTVLPGETSEGNDFGFVGRFNLVLSKTAVGDPQPDAALDYVISVFNEGPAPALGPITVTDQVPAALTITGLDAPGWTCTTTGQAVECVLNGDLAADATASITIHTTVTGQAGDEITNTAAVVVSGPVGEPVVTDNVDSVTVTIGQLPHTGTEITRFVVIGFLLLAAGFLLLVATRRREEEGTER